MKQLTIIALCLAPLFSVCQFHVAVEPNPVHKGEVAPHWHNNYVITFTRDNWKTKTILHGQATYVGRDDNGIEYKTSYYQPCVFQHQSEAIAFAKKFKTLKSAQDYNANQLTAHNTLKPKWEADNKKLCFGCKDKKITQAKTVIVH